MSCPCSKNHQSRRIVLTGGPGAGKTAVLEVVRIAMCQHIIVLPEAAGIVFGGGFPRGSTSAAKQRAQRAIYFVQRELEPPRDDENAAVVICDRGTVDGLAYWTGEEDLWAAVGSSLDAELARYDAVIHLRTPSADDGYNHSNPLRVETAQQAAAIDSRIAQAWSRHPRRFEIPASPDFFAKVVRALTIINRELPACCRRAETVRDLLMATA